MKLPVSEIQIERKEIHVIRRKNTHSYQPPDYCHRIYRTTALKVNRLAIALQEIPNHRQVGTYTIWIDIA